MKSLAFYNFLFRKYPGSFFIIIVLLLVVCAVETSWALSGA